MESVGGKRGREKEEGTTRDDVEGPGNNPTLPVHPLASRHVPLVSNCPLRSNATKRNWHVHAPLESSCSIQRCLGCHRWKLSSLLRRQPMLSHTSSLPSVRELLSTYTLHMHPVGRPVVVLTQFFSLQIGQENVPRYMIKEEPNGHADAVQQFCNIHLQQRKKNKATVQGGKTCVEQMSPVPVGRKYDAVQSRRNRNRDMQPQRAGEHVAYRHVY